LQERVAADRDEPVAPPREQETDPIDDVPSADDAEPRAPVERRASTDERTAQTDGASERGTRGAVDVTDSIRRGEPERQETAGKGPDSPRTSSRPAAAGSEPGPAAPSLPTGSANTTTNGVAIGPAAQPAVAPAVTARSGEALVRGVDGPAFRPSTPTRAPAVQAGYATSSAASAEMVERARDSVFRQILMKLTGDGGEMRLRLEPPELGELDLRLVVEGGNKLSLSITADRPDVMQLLQRHLDELKQALQQNGLEVTDAHVEAKSQDARRQHGQHAGDAPADKAPERAPTPRSQRSGGFITATGLDFWA
jgi:flagellar hook-length control protein FliK